MNGFISHIIQHHLQTENNVQPRLPGRFESFHTTQNHEGMVMDESDGARISPNQKINNSADHFFEKSIAENQNAPDGFGKVADEIKDLKNNQLQKPEFDPSDVDNLNLFEESITTPPGKQSIADRAHDKDVRGNLITNINPGIFTNENADQPARKETFSPGPVMPENPSSLVFQKYRHSDANQNGVFFENLKQKAEPMIKVSIGRIEVRAIVSPQVAKKETNTTQKPEMTLEDYLNKRNDKK